MLTFKEDIQSKGTLTFQLPPPLFAKSLAWPLKLGLSISLLFFAQSSVSKEARDIAQASAYIFEQVIRKEYFEQNRWKGPQV